MDKLVPIAALSLGGAFGVNARFWFGVWVNRWASQQFPWATLLINVTGSFAIGFLTTVLVRWLPHPNARLFVITGFLGGYTTYSTFAFESETLWERGEKVASLGYMASTVLVGFLAVWLGTALARGLTMPGPGGTVPDGPALQARDRRLAPAPAPIREAKGRDAR